VIVYVALRKRNVVYVGQTVMRLSARRGKHFSVARKGGGSVFGAAIRKHGEKCFAFKEIAKCNSRDALNRWERRLIASMSPKYNLQDGGQDSFVPWNKGKKETRPEVLQNISNAARQRVCASRGSYSREHREKIGLATRMRTQKAFVCEQTGQSFLNQIDAAKAYGLNPKSLAVLLSGKTRLRSLGGYTFRYL
jgi:hypothetical protein